MRDRLVLPEGGQAADLMALHRYDALTKEIALSQDLIRQFDTIFGQHPGLRPA